ncbi:MAG TPA: hypothetical protein VGN26_16790 [Armatimonadota bacterium]|jgi:hypothetical protein
MPAPQQTEPKQPTTFMRRLKHRLALLLLAALLLGGVGYAVEWRYHPIAKVQALQYARGRRKVTNTVHASIYLDREALMRPRLDALVGEANTADPQRRSAYYRGIVDGANLYLHDGRLIDQERMAKHTLALGHNLEAHLTTCPICLKELDRERR